MKRGWVIMRPRPPIPFDPLDPLPAHNYSMVAVERYAELRRQYDDVEAWYAEKKQLEFLGYTVF